MMTFPPIAPLTAGRCGLIRFGEPALLCAFLGSAQTQVVQMRLFIPPVQRNVPWNDL